MKSNLQTAQGVVSILAILCLVAGWFHLFSDDINDLLSRKLFYILIGISFILQAPLLTNPKLIYPMYGAAALCIIGAFLPTGSNLSGIKTIGLLAGVVISFSSRSISRR